MTTMGKLMVAAGALALAGPVSAASVVGAVKVRVTSALPDWLQVGEVQAVEFGTGINVALAANGGTAAGSGNFSAASTPDKAIDGIAPASFANIYHSDSAGAGEFLDVFFAAPTTLSSLTIFGRVDCCSTRDLFDVTIYNAAGDTLYTGRFDNTRLVGAGNTVTFDAAGAVPEPATWAMMIGGFGLIGASLRRRAARVAFAR